MALHASDQSAAIEDAPVKNAAPQFGALAIGRSGRHSLLFVVGPRRDLADQSALSATA